MAKFLSLVVSGKSYPDIRKEALINKSSYFSALLSGNFKDSFNSCYKFDRWSTSAFEIVLRYMTTGRIELKGKDIDALRTAMEISEFWIMDGFKPALARTLINSWTSMNTESAFELAEELGVLRKLQDYSFVKVFSFQEQEIQSAATEFINHDILTLVTGLETFLKFRMNEMELFSEVWEKAIQSYRTVLKLAAGLPLRLHKVRALIRNLRLRNWNRQHWSAILEAVGSDEPVSCYFKTLLEEILIEERLQMRKALSHVRFVFERGSTKIRTFGILEFNLDRWSWELKECDGKFTSSCCVTTRDYATFLGPRGLFIIRKCNRNPKVIENRLIGERVSDYYDDEVVCCISGKYLFILVQRDDGEDSLLCGFNLFTKSFIGDVHVPLKRSRLKGHGDCLYIVGYSFDELREMRVFEYQVKTEDFRLIARTNGYGFPVNLLAVLKRKLFVLSDNAYTCVDTTRSVDQLVNVETYKGFVPDMWEFGLQQVCSASESLLLLLRVTCTEWEFRDYMLANLNPVTGEMTCLGILPAMAKKYDDIILAQYNYLPQIQTRKPRNAFLPDSEDVIEKLKRFE